MMCPECRVKMLTERTTHYESCVRRTTRCGQCSRRYMSVDQIVAEIPPRPPRLGKRVRGTRKARRG